VHSDNFNAGTLSQLPHPMGDALPYIDQGTGETVIKVAAGEIGACTLLTHGIKCWG